MKIKVLFLTIVLVTFSWIINAQENKTKIVNLNDAEYAETSFNDIISQFEGKVIYLDFWASWCRPCRNEMPYSSELKKKLEGEDVVFVYISSDRDSTAWKNAIKELNINGYNYLTNVNVYKQYQSLYEVKTIPRYILFNKKGEAVNVNATRPRHPQTLTEIKKLLEE